MNYTHHTARIKGLQYLVMCLTAALMFTGCTEQKPSTGVYLLLDTSGTYTKELKKAQQVIHYYLGNLNPGDSFAVARIDSGSFSEKDIIAKATFDLRPSKANEQKRQFAETINQFVETVKSSAYTDISGGMLQASEYLNEINAARKVVLVFSDMKEEIPKGYNRDFTLDLEGYEVIALNVTKLRSDNMDPNEYMERMSKWQRKVESGGGSWRIINDMDREGALAL